MDSGDVMKFLLTSSGISNQSINDALVELLGKPIAESTALCIPTAIYPSPNGAAGAYNLIRGLAKSPFTELGWKSLGVLELTALPSIKESDWIPVVRGIDALLVGRRTVVFELLDAALRIRGHTLVARERDGLRGSERREHGGGTELRRALRRTEPARRP